MLRCVPGTLFKFSKHAVSFVRDVQHVLRPRMLSMQPPQKAGEGALSSPRLMHRSQFNDYS